MLEYLLEMYTQDDMSTATDLDIMSLAWLQRSTLIGYEELLWDSALRSGHGYNKCLLKHKVIERGLNFHQSEHELVLGLQRPCKIAKPGALPDISSQLLGLFEIRKSPSS